MPIIGSRAGAKSRGCPCKIAETDGGAEAGYHASGMGCDYCGAPIARSTEAPTICVYCGRSNDPLPKQVEVPVPVQVVQNVVNVVGAPPEALRELRCPHCRKRLVTVIAKDVELAGCGGCGGIWIDNASTRRVLADPESIFAVLAKRAGDNAKNRRVREPNPACPECTAVLDRVRPHGIELDVCADHGTWFDAFELATLVKILRGEVSGVKGAGRSVRCALCHAEIVADRANITEYGLTCEACWRGEQRELEQQFDEKIGQAGGAVGGVAVGGILLGVAAAMLSGSSSS